MINLPASTSAQFLQLFHHSHGHHAHTRHFAQSCDNFVEVVDGAAVAEFVRPRFGWEAGDDQFAGGGFKLHPTGGLVHPLHGLGLADVGNQLVAGRVGRSRSRCARP